MIVAVEAYRPPRMLVVDNDSDTLASTATLLQLNGYEVETAPTGPEAIAKVPAFQPDLALLDLGMPGMDGCETARRIERLVVARPPILVAVSGYGDIGTKQRSAAAGFDLHLIKPVETSVLEEMRVLVDQAGRLADRAMKVRQQQREATLFLARSYIQTGYTLLQVATTTEADATKERCLGKARRICDLLFSWIERFPHLQAVRQDLDDLSRHVPR
jgi:CheY-like chemotaxis protein